MGVALPRALGILTGVWIAADADDFSAVPWAYPGTASQHSGLLDGERFHAVADAAMLDALLVRAGAAPVSERHLVVAVGSNASPAVMRRKLERGGVSTVVPFLKVTMSGVAVGHSAHVSPPGYIPATPYGDDSSTVALRATLLDDRQLERVDATEPKYRRRLLGSSRCRLSFDGFECPDEVWLYESVCGVLTAPESGPVPLTEQRRLMDLLRQQLSGWGDLVGGGSGEDVALRLAADPDLREASREHFARTGWACASGLPD